VERFAPRFRDLVLARSVLSPADLERRNPNYVGPRGARPTRGPIRDGPIAHKLAPDSPTCGSAGASSVIRNRRVKARRLQ